MNRVEGALETRPRTSKPRAVPDAWSLQLLGNVRALDDLRQNGVGSVV